MSRQLKIELGSLFQFCLSHLEINKQLDLQSALTEVGRLIAFREGWYEQRRIIQISFVVLIAFVCAIALIALFVWVRSAPTATTVAFFGTGLVLGFVLIRASSFHHVRSVY